MNGKTRWPLAQAEEIAQSLVGALVPSCQRVPVVAGSIRRRRPDVGDIELLCVPMYMEHRNMLGDVTATTDLLDVELRFLMEQGELAKRPSGYGHMNKFLVHKSGIWVDVFTATEKNWGRDLLVRTGSADFNKRVMREFIRLGKRGHAYGDAAVTLQDGTPVYAPDEQTMFDLLEWPFIEPEARV